MDHLNKLNQVKGNYKERMEQYKDNNCYDDDDHGGFAPTIQKGELLMQRGLRGAPQLIKNPTRNPRRPMIHIDIAPPDMTAVKLDPNTVGATLAAAAVGVSIWWWLAAAAAVAP